MNSKDTEAIFHIRKSREALRDDEDRWADHMLRAVQLVGIDRVSELADDRVCDVASK